MANLAVAKPRVPLPHPPAVSHPPRILPLLQNQVLTPGQRCMYEARVVGEPAPAVSWFHNGQPVTPGVMVQVTKFLKNLNIWVTCTWRFVCFQVLKDGEWQRLIINRVGAEHAGEYMLRATNEAGEAKSVANLTINEPQPPPVPAKPAPPPGDIVSSATQVNTIYTETDQLWAASAVEAAHVLLAAAHG